VGASRALGALLCVACAAVAVLHIYFGYVMGTWALGTLSFALPITIGLLVILGLGFWLGWIMATTKEVAPPPTAAETPEEKREKRRAL